MTNGSPSTASTLYAFYDLSVAPISFNFVTFMVLAELERIKLDRDSISLVIVPSEDLSSHCMEKNQQSRLSTEQLIWRKSNILLPVTTLVPSCRQVTYCRTRNEAGDIFATAGDAVYPAGYAPNFSGRSPHFGQATIAACQGHEIPTLSVSEQALKYIRQWIDRWAGGRKVVAITLRMAEYRSFLNSNIDAWTAFARRLDPDQYFPVFIPDIDTCLELPDSRFDGLTIFNEPVFNVQLRAALLEEAYINMFVSNGTNELAYYNGKCRFLWFNTHLRNTVSDQKNRFGVSGLNDGCRVPFFTPYQKLVWKWDDPDILISEFDALDKLIQCNPGDAFKRHRLKSRDTSDQMLDRAAAFAAASYKEEAQALLEAFQTNNLPNPKFLRIKSALEKGIDYFDGVG
jgi:hypothetical protein